MRIVLTGAAGFLGWHTRARLHGLTSHEVVAVHRGNWGQLAYLVKDADVVIHVAGVNRGDQMEVEEENVRLARDVASAVGAGDGRPTIIFANSIQAGNDTPYGAGKARAAEVLATAARRRNSSFVDVKLPNLFGEHGRPAYNSFVATFVGAVINDEQPPIVDRAVGLLHVQRAAQSLIDQITAQSAAVVEPASTPTTVRAVFDILQRQHRLYLSGDIPELLNALDIDLFNTLRAARFPAAYPIGLTSRHDHRGNLVEVVRAHGGQGQTFVSTTVPGVTRGDHFHLRKVERFVVLSGEARISLRRLFTDDVVHFEVCGDEPVVVDMPTMWVHNITNTGPSELTTLFWTHELFDPEAPDTFPEKVHVRGEAEGR